MCWCVSGASTAWMCVASKVRNCLLLMVVVSVLQCGFRVFSHTLPLSHSMSDNFGGQFGLPSCACACSPVHAWMRWDTCACQIPYVISDETCACHVICHHVFPCMRIVISTSRVDAGVMQHTRCYTTHDVSPRVMHADDMT